MRRERPVQGQCPSACANFCASLHISTPPVRTEFGTGLNPGLRAFTARTLIRYFFKVRDDGGGLIPTESYGTFTANVSEENSFPRFVDWNLYLRLQENPLKLLSHTIPWGGHVSKHFSSKGLSLILCSTN